MCTPMKYTCFSKCIFHLSALLYGANVHLLFIQLTLQDCSDGYWKISQGWQGTEEEKTEHFLSSETQMEVEEKEVTNEFLHFFHITHFVVTIVRNKYKTFPDVEHHVNIPINTSHLPSASLHISDTRKLLYYKRRAGQIS
jgi:hypothetical protein